MVMGVCEASEVNNWTVFDSLDLTSQEQEELVHTSPGTEYRYYQHPQAYNDDVH